MAGARAGAEPVGRCVSPTPEPAPDPAATPAPGPALDAAARAEIATRSGAAPGRALPRPPGGAQAGRPGRPATQGRAHMPPSSVTTTPEV